MSLAENDGPCPWHELPFTHILNPARTGGFETLPLFEWASLKLGRHVGFEVPAAVLVPLSGGMPRALLVERFCIRRNAADTRRRVMEDLCSVLSLSPERRYDSTLERVGRAVRPLSTDPEADLPIILKRALFAWLIADCDLHLKNMALLKIAEAGATSFVAVRSAPLYGAVTTRVFPRLAEDRRRLRSTRKTPV